MRNRASCRTLLGPIGFKKLLAPKQQNRLSFLQIEFDDQNIAGITPAQTLKRTETVGRAVNGDPDCSARYPVLRKRGEFLARKVLASAGRTPDYSGLRRSGNYRSYP